VKKYPLGSTLEYQALKHQSISFSLGLMYYMYDDKEKIKDMPVAVTIEYFLKETSDQNSTLGIKFGGDVTNRKVFTYGYNFAGYTDFINFEIVFAPEAGIGYNSFYLVFRRNLFLTDNGLNFINKNNLSLKIFIPFDKRWIR
jgi:hypothetical protein